MLPSVTSYWHAIDIRWDIEGDGIPINQEDLPLP